MSPSIVQFKVRYTCQAYNARIGRLSASSTSSSRDAAVRMGEKLFGPSFRSAELMGNEGLQASLWCAIGDAITRAWCMPSGEIVFYGDRPEGATQVAKGPAAALREVVASVARCAEDGRLFVPLYDVASTQAGRTTAIALWVNHLIVSNGRPGRFGVEFVRGWEGVE